MENVLKWSCIVGRSESILLRLQRRWGRQVTRAILTIIVVKKGAVCTVIHSRLQEMCSKKSHDVRHEGHLVRNDGKKGVIKKAGLSGRGKQVGKGKVEEGKRRSRNDEGEDGGREQAVDVIIRHRCVFDAICALNYQLSDIQKEAVRRIIWSSVLECRIFTMDRHMVQALLEAWNPENKCFKLGRREVPFSQFDVA
ncbi:hypothetical protein Cgig2_003803 [Carnegiea gigantea]|uniref:Uncharacterized protein n=1 Tax=Carnegiea gigantea TaxID=171969 RepID=A0A9Q1QCY8_9CARY|nr:hypothetical protein Cgig2_003803 [Carnegiea gigantea]